MEPHNITIADDPAAITAEQNGSETAVLEIVEGLNKSDLSPHTAELNELWKRVTNSSHQLVIVKILQHLLNIPPTNGDNEDIWNIMEEIVLWAINPQNTKQGLNVIVRNGDECDNTTARRAPIPTPPPPPPTTWNIPVAPTPLPPTPPPPPSTWAIPVAPTSLPPPPPPLPATGSSIPGTSTPLPPPPPPPMSSPMTATTASSASDTNSLEEMPQQSLWPQQSPPTPKSKMKTIPWDTIPSSEIVGGKNLWTIFASKPNEVFRKPIEWQEAESSFCLRSHTINTLESTMKGKTKLRLINAQHTFNVDIFLEQFKGLKSDEDIIELVRDGKRQMIGADKIKRLEKLLPEADEIEILKNFNGDRGRMVRSEKFLLHLIEVPNYKLRIESMSLVDDFTENVESLNSSIKVIIQAGNELINNKELHEVLHIIVLVGNFLNSGKFSGNTLGIRISSLLNISQTRSNINHMHFLHFIVGQIKKSHPRLMKFPDNLKNLDKVNRINIEQISSDVNTLYGRLRDVRTQIELPETEDDIREQMREFLLEAGNQIDNLKNNLKEMELMRLNLAKFFCENPPKFKLRDCFMIFEHFVKDFTNAVNEVNATLLKRRQSEQVGLRENSKSAKSSNKLAPESNLNINSYVTIRRKSTINYNFINKEILRENQERKFGKTVSSGKAEISQISDTQETPAWGKTILRKKREVTYENPKRGNEPSHMSVAEKIRKFADINNQKESKPQIPRKTPSMKTIIPTEDSEEIPAIPKLERIGVRMMSINDNILQNVITNLKPTPRGESLWKIPRDKLLRNNAGLSIANEDHKPNQLGKSKLNTKLVEQLNMQSMELGDNDKRRQSRSIQQSKDIKTHKVKSWDGDTDGKPKENPPLNTDDIPESKLQTSKENNSSPSLTTRLFASIKRKFWP